MDEKQIREKFKDHKATIYKFVCNESKDEGNLYHPVSYHPAYVLSWQKPGTLIYGVSYTLMNGQLSIFGDLFYAQFVLPAKSFKDIAALDFSYYMSKCVSSYDGRDGKVWSEAFAANRIMEALTEELREMQQDMKPEPEIEEYRRVMDEALASCGDRYEWSKFLDSRGGDAFGDSYYEYGEIGMRVNWIYRAHHIGIKMAVEQLSDKGAK